MHRDIFNLKEEDLWMDLGYDDVELGYQINKNGYKIKELPFFWNHMSMFSEEWNNYKSRFDSYILHYDGRGHLPNIDRTEQIRQDALILDKYNLLM